MNFGTSELVEYQSLLGELKRRLGLSCIMVYERDELMPYYIIALRHILEILITEDLINPESVAKIIELYDSGQEQIVSYNLPEMLSEYGVNLGGDFNPIFWVDAWVDLMKTLYVQLAYNYANLFTEESFGCQCSCELDDGTYVLPEKSALGSQYIKSCGCGG
jgi:hypothetical protein